jgi:uncharacterized protein (TIGR02118 family)
MSITVTVMYPDTAGSKFDMDYYLKSHGPLVHKLWGPHGLTGLKVVKGLATPDPNAPAPYRIIALVGFESLDHLMAAFQAHGAEVMGDIANFTDAPPQIQINEDVV